MRMHLVGGGVKAVAGSGALSVGGAFDDEGVGVACEAVDGGLCEQGVGGHGEPFGGFAVGCDDGGADLVAFDDEFVEVVGFGGVEGSEGEVVDDEDVDGGQSAEFGVDGVVEACGA